MPANTARIQKRIGHNVRAIRKSHGLSIDKVARAAQNSLGKPWHTSTIAEIEYGRGGTSIEQVVTLAMALSEASGQPVTVHDLIQGPGLIEITPWVHITPERLAQILSGGDARPQGKDMRIPDKPEPLIGKRSGQPVLTLADMRAKQRLGIDTATFLNTSHKLWGHPLSDETQKRAGTGANAQKKGIITRQLQREMRDALNA